MLVFPQLATGACAQFPLERRRRRRTIQNQMEDGTSVRYADTGAGTVAWTIELQSLSDAEVQAIAGLFNAAEGRLHDFTFLDPAANLLSWSEDLKQPVWQAGPGVQISPGAADPNGTTRASGVVNASQAPQRLSQQLPVPAAYQYCFSVYARSSGGSALTLFVAGSSGESSLQAAVNANWKRILFAAAPGGTAESVTFGVELAEGASVELFGFQVEAQPSASAYMRTAAGSSVYMARFDEDELLVTRQSQGNSAATIRIVTSDGV